MYHKHHRLYFFIAVTRYLIKGVWEFSSVVECASLASAKASLQSSVLKKTKRKTTTKYA